MKSSIASFELKHLVEEIDFVQGGKINKIFEPEKKELVLDIHVPSKGRQLIKIVAGKYICTIKDKEDMGEASSFCKYLRKQLHNSRIKSFKQCGVERVVEIELETFEDGQEEIKYLYLEFYGKGNIIYCDKEKEIINLAEIHKFKDRIVKRGNKYEIPKSKYNYNEINKTDLKNLLGYSEENIVKTLATSLGLGGTYSEEVCLIVGIDKNKAASEVNDSDIEKIQQGLIKVLSKERKPRIIYKLNKDDELEEDKIKDVVPIELETLKEFKTEEFKAYGEAVEKFFEIRESLKVDDARLKSYKDKEQKLLTIIETQQKILDQNTIAQEENQDKGNKIYENYQLVDNIIKQFKVAWKEKGLKEIQEAVKDKKEIRKITKEGKITINLD